MIKKVLVYLVLNFLALFVGGFSTSEEVRGVWYQSLDKAPWSPPGWFFGIAWSIIMIAFAFFMAKFDEYLGNNARKLYVLQWILNVVWSPVFFKFQLVGTGVVLISLLAILVWILFYLMLDKNKKYSLMILPYGFWMLIASSLNIYIFLYSSY